MRPTTSNDIRKAFLEFFQEIHHEIVPSAPLLQKDNPTLLFTNAGMNQFVDVFLGKEKRPYKRATTAQKVMRVQGKQNDLENVGPSARHHTFFEMLGNFSFGDYFKREAIDYAWTFLTGVMALEPARLFATVYTDDDEAADLWQRYLPVERILRFGKKDNFWQMGDLGPCGPCSEIHYYSGDMATITPRGVNNDDYPEYVEVWNLVFMQFDLQPDGSLIPLPHPSVDTGMGLERLTAVAQGRLSNYDSDLFTPLLAAIGRRAGAEYGAMEQADRSMRVIADHLRAITFLMADGVLPSNEGRGYVLRRILRRAARHGRLLGITEPFLHELTATVVDQMGEAYHELRHAAGTVAEATRGEEERFIATLDQGLPILNDMISKVKASGQQVLQGTEIFKLYDTYGFPMDLIAEACREQGITLDETGFEAAIEEQRTRARKTGGFEHETARPVLSDVATRVGTTAFVGYERLDSEGVVQALLQGDRLIKEAREGDEIELVLDVTPFYAEGGGQAGDQGVLTGTDGRVEIRETTRPVPTLIVHKGVVTSGSIRAGERLQLSVNPRTRQDAARNHTATHLVHAALRDLLGPHVKQYGSLVAPNRLRFDFAHFRPMSSRDIDEIESIVNELPAHVVS